MPPIQFRFPFVTTEFDLKDNMVGSVRIQEKTDLPPRNLPTYLFGIDHHDMIAHVLIGKKCGLVFSL